ncbi:MAG: hypothetical protein GY778_25620, partial [bacterium]|nr:hypothetical protein [bacterium]
ALFVSRDGGRPFQVVPVDSATVGQAIVGAAGTVFALVERKDGSGALLVLVRGKKPRWSPLPVTPVVTMQAAAGHLVVLGERELAISSDRGRSFRKRTVPSGRWGATHLRVDDNGRVQLASVSGSIDCDGGYDRVLGRLGGGRFRDLAWPPDTQTPTLGPGGWAYAIAGCGPADKNGEPSWHVCAYGPRGQIVAGPTVDPADADNPTLASNGRDTFLATAGQLLRVRGPRLRLVGNLPDSWDG